MTVDRTLVMTVCTLSLGSWMSGCSSLRPPLANTSSQIQPSTSTIPSPTISKNSTPADRAIPHYKHIFTIVAENKGYAQIIGSPNAPRINQFAKTYGLASNFYGEVHPSEAKGLAIK